MEEAKRLRVSDCISEEDIKSWTPEIPVIILSGTGTGKSHFIKNKLYDFAKEKGERILMLIHRTNCVDQFRMEIEAAGKQETIDVRTYQKIQYDELHKESYDLNPFGYVVSDEFHYFLGDANFNNATDVSFEKIMSIHNAVKIFMSATGEEVAEYIRLYGNVEPLVYRLDIPKPSIDHLTFYTSDSSLKILAKALIEKGEKGIFFLNSAQDAYKLYKEFKDYAIFNCSRKNQLHKYVDDEEIARILKNEKFDCPMMITTACMDAGVNLIDPDLRHIITDIGDVGSLIQCLGRKRSQSDDDIADVYIKFIPNSLLGSKKGRISQSLTMANYLKTHTPAEFLEEYPRRVDTTGIIYDVPVSGSKQYSVKRVNDLMYHKRTLDIKQIDDMIAYGEYGYSKYIARLLGKYDYAEEYGRIVMEVCDYAVMKGDGSLENYLDAHVGHVMLNGKDREELIKKLNVKRDGKLKHSRDILNAALREDKLPYQIEEFETSRTENGRKKNYKHAWRIIRYTEERTTDSVN